MKNIIIALALSLFSFTSFAGNTIVYNTKDVSTSMDGKVLKGTIAGKKVNCTAHNAEVKEKEIYFIYNCKKPYTVGIVLDRKTLNSVVLLSKGDMRKAQQFPVLSEETTKVD